MENETDKEVVKTGALTWFALLGAAVAWMLHLSLTYPLTAFYCDNGAAYALFVISGVTGLAAVAAGVAGWWGYRRLPEEEREGLSRESSRRGFMLYLGILLSGLFLLAIILATIPMLVLDPCTF